MYVNENEVILTTEDVEEQKKLKKKMIIVIIAFLVILIGFTIFAVLKYNKDYDFKPVINENGNVVYINKMIKNSIVNLNLDIKRVNKTKMPTYEFLNSVVVPDDFDKKDDIKGVYIKNEDSDGFNTLNNYELHFYNTSNNRKITLLFSNSNIPIRDYEFDSVTDKESTINDIKFKIYQSENKYQTSFTFNDFNFDIESNDVTQAEFINFIKSIIK